MTGVIPLLPPHAFMVWTQKKLLLSNMDVKPNIVVQWLKFLLSKVPVIEFRSRNGLASIVHIVFRAMTQVPKFRRNTLPSFSGFKLIP